MRCTVCGRLIGHNEKTHRVHDRLWAEIRVNQKERSGAQKHPWEVDHEELRRLRMKIGFTQQQIAQELRVHQNTISRWERDVHVPPPEVQHAWDHLIRSMI